MEGILKVEHVGNGIPGWSSMGPLPASFKIRSEINCAPSFLVSKWLSPVSSILEAKAAKGSFLFHKGLQSFSLFLSARWPRKWGTVLWQDGFANPVPLLWLLGVSYSYHDRLQLHWASMALPFRAEACTCVYVSARTHVKLTASGLEQRMGRLSHACLSGKDLHERTQNCYQKVGK